MKALFWCADDYLKQSTWRDLALLKICLCALGILLGLCVSQNDRKKAALAAAAVFVATDIPLTLKFLRIVCARCKRQSEGPF